MRHGTLGTILAPFPGICLRLETPRTAAGGTVVGLRKGLTFRCKRSLFEDNVLHTRMKLERYLLRNQINLHTCFCLSLHLFFGVSVTENGTVLTTIHPGCLLDPPERGSRSRSLLSIEGSGLSLKGLKPSASWPPTGPE